MSSPPRLTAELFSIPLAAVPGYLVYAPLRQAAFVANRAAVNRLADLSDEQFTPSGSADEESFITFLRLLGIVDGGEEEAPVTTRTGVPKPTEVTLFLTTSCNLRCTYCYAAAGDTARKAMPLAVARRGIDFVAQNALELGRPHFDIIYHGGGEPTVNWNTLTESYQYARSKADATGLQLRATLATNAVLADSQIEWITKHLDGASVSLDGGPEVQDKHRLSLLGQGSSQRVAHTLQAFDEAEFPYGIRMTVTREHLPLIEQSVGYICQHFHPTRIQVEPVFAMGRWQGKPTGNAEEFLAGFRAARKRAEEAGISLEFSGARLGTLSNHFCGATQDAFALTADGTVSACYETFLEENEFASTFHYGRENSNGGYTFQLPVLNQLRAQTVEHRSYCQDCFAKWSCGGDCLHKVLSDNPSGEFAGTERCHIIRELTKDQILARIQASGGVYWHELAPWPSAEDATLLTERSEGCLAQESSV